MKNSNVCCTCGREIPEGRLICPICESCTTEAEDILKSQSAATLRTKTDKFGLALSIVNALMLIAIFIKVVSL